MTGRRAQPLARAQRLAGLALASLAALACDRGDELERRSAGEVAHAEQTARNADNALKRRALPGLSTPCTGEQPCEVQRLCREAYTSHVESVELTQAAKQLVGDGKPEEAAKLLGSAQQKLEQARAQVETCTERAAALRRSYRL